MGDLFPFDHTPTHINKQKKNMESNNEGIFLLPDAIGFNNMKDEVMIHVHPEVLLQQRQKQEDETQHFLRRFVIFFPGDVQLKLSAMLGRNGYQEWAHECFENTIQRALVTKYPELDTVICIIGPTTSNNTLNEFDHFYEAGSACLHLIGLIDSVKKYLSQEIKSVQFSSDERYELLAFSKGCVALNTILSEIASLYQYEKYGKKELLFWETAEGRKFVLPFYHVYLRNFNSSSSIQKIINNRDRIHYFYNNIEKVHWLDCHRYINNSLVNKLLTELFGERHEPTFYLHATPFIEQTSPYRRHIKLEYNNFLRECKPICKTQLYFQNKSFTFQVHFDILRAFKPRL